MSEIKNYNKFIDEIIKEVEDELEESTATGNIDGYQTPYAFGDDSEKNKNRKKQVATQAGYTVVDNDIKNINESTGHKEIDKLYKNKEHLMHYLYYDWNREFPMFNDKEIIILRAILSKTPNLRQSESLLKDVKKSRKLQDSIKQMALDIKTESVTESFSKPNSDAKKKLKGMFRLPAKQFGQMNDYIYYDKNKKQWWFVDTEGDLISLNNTYYLKQIGDYVKKNNININESINEADRDYAAEYQARKKDYYKKYQSSDKAKKYRAELNQYNRKKGTYGNGDGLDASHKGGKIVGFETENKNRSRKEKSRLKKEDVNEAKNPKRTNRWLELKNDDTMHGHKKLAVGLKELKYQLAEVEKFLGWYNKLKNINELDSDNYWKRTNNNIYKIKERLINIVKKIQEIEK